MLLTKVPQSSDWFILQRICSQSLGLYGIYCPLIPQSGLQLDVRQHFEMHSICSPLITMSYIVPSLVWQCQTAVPLLFPELVTLPTKLNTHSSLLAGSTVMVLWCTDERIYTTKHNIKLNARAIWFVPAQRCVALNNSPHISIGVWMNFVLYISWYACTLVVLVSCASSDASVTGYSQSHQCNSTI